MKTENVLLVICGTLVIVVLINAGILVAMLRSNYQGQFKALGKLFQSARNPWHKEDEDYRELRQRVADLDHRDAEELDNED
jgi:hypothetical protein